MLATWVVYNARLDELDPADQVTDGLRQELSDAVGKEYVAASEDPLFGVYEVPLHERSPPRPPALWRPSTALPPVLSCHHDPASRLWEVAVSDSPQWSACIAKLHSIRDVKMIRGLD